MDHENERPSRGTGRVNRRRLTVGAIGASALLVAFGASQLQGAGADPIESSIAATCALGTSTVDVTVPVTVDDKIDPLSEGGQSILETRTGLPSLPIEVTVNKLVVTTPIPTQIASTDAVTFGEGNMTPSYEVIGSDLVVTFTGPVQSSAIQVPTVTAEQTVATGTGSTSIDWKTFSKIDADTNYGVAVCTPNDPNQVVNSTTITAAPPPTTEPTPPPTTAPTTPTTTAPTTPPTTAPPTTPPPTTPPSTQPPTSPPTAPPSSPSPIPKVPGVPPLPLPPVPVPPPATPPQLPVPPVPPLPVPPVGEPCPVTGLPPLPVIGCPVIPPPPNPDVDVDADIEIDLTIGLGL